MSMTKLDESAVIISNETNKYNKRKGANAGFITNNSKDFRVFMGGDLDNIITGLSLVIVNLCKESNAKVEYVLQKLVDDVVSITGFNEDEVENG